MQEYGAPSTDLTDALSSRGANVTSIALYRWALPEDVGPLRRAVGAICDGSIDVLLVTSGVQLTHLWRSARELDHVEELRHRLATHVLLASIGPAATEAMVHHRLRPDLEASPPKMGILVTEAASRSAELLATKRGR